MTNEQATDYAAAVQTLAPFNLSLPTTASTVAEVVAEVLSVKEKRGASARYLQDLRFRLTRFAEAFRKDTCTVTCAELQAWLDSQKLAPQSYASYRFAQTGDAGRVAGELGNSAAVVHRHYRQLVKPADAQRWFAVKPETPANVVAITAVEAHA